MEKLKKNWQKRLERGRKLYILWVYKDSRRNDNWKKEKRGKMIKKDLDIKDLVLYFKDFYTGAYYRNWDHSGENGTMKHAIIHL